MPQVWKVANVVSIFKIDSRKLKTISNVLECYFNFLYKELQFHVLYHYYQCPSMAHLICKQIRKWQSQWITSTHMQHIWRPLARIVSSTLPQDLGEQPVFQAFWNIIRMEALWISETGCQVWTIRSAYEEFNYLLYCSSLYGGIFSNWWFAPG